MRLVALARRVARTARQLPPAENAAWAWRSGCERVAATVQRRLDRVRPSLRLAPPPGLRPTPLLDDRPLADAARAAVRRDVLERYLAHRFDLLGSGWVTVRHRMSCPGFEGHRYDAAPPAAPDRAGAWLGRLVDPANVAACRRVWSLIGPDYVPIDWQLDFKSGYRWSERTWYQDVPIGADPGADVKVPWELARMQHLPQLALGALAFPELRARCGQELRDEVLDFIATNPPRFGANWASAMDVGIRVASWVVAYDLLRLAGVTYDAPFVDVLLASAFAHAEFLAGNTQRWPCVRGNHYLAEIVGLAFAAAWLGPSRATDRWLAFAARELARETPRQFFADGANFEGSTSYHRLSAEIVVYGTALLLGAAGRHSAGAALSADDHLALIGRMAAFTRDVTAPDGRVALVGDHDNGRFLKLHVPWQEPAGDLEEDFTDHGHLLGAIEGLVPAAHSSSAPIETTVARALAHGRASRIGAAVPTPVVPLGAGDAWSRAERDWAAAPPERTAVYRLAPGPGPDLRADLELRAYPGWGVYVFRSPRLFLLVRCGPTGQAGHGGHDHNDQLGLELWLDGVPWIVDPGTYCYTPAPDLRNLYRSVASHWAPRPADGAEPAGLGALFALESDPRARCLHFGPQGFIGEHQGYGGRTRRIVALAEGCVEVRDLGPRPLAPLDVPATDARPVPPAPVFAPAYGVRRPRANAPEQAARRAP
jgi:hypothetical protein